MGSSYRYRRPHSGALNQVRPTIILIVRRLCELGREDELDLDKDISELLEWSVRRRKRFATMISRHFRLPVRVQPAVFGDHTTVNKVASKIRQILRTRVPGKDRVIVKGEPVGHRPHPHHR